MLRDCSARSLVMIDELGRGTSVRDGAGLAGAVLETLDSMGVGCIFATHLHELLRLPLRLKNVTLKRMGISSSDASATGRSSAAGISSTFSYKLEDGVCLDSLALDTAAEFGLSSEIIERARGLTFEYDQCCQPRNLNITQSLAQEINHAAPPVSLPSPAGPLNNIADGEKHGHFRVASVLPILRQALQQHGSRLSISSTLASSINDKLTDQGEGGDGDITLVAHDRQAAVALEGTSCVYIIQAQKEKVCVIKANLSPVYNIKKISHQILCFQISLIFSRAHCFIMSAKLNQFRSV